MLPFMLPEDSSWWILSPEAILKQDLRGAMAALGSLTFLFWLPEGNQLHPPGRGIDIL